MAAVDVIIPFYNTPLAFVEQALASLRSQTLSHWQAYIVNDTLRAKAFVSRNSGAGSGLGLYRGRFAGELKRLRRAL